MSVAVVYLFEVVQVNEQHLERHSVPVEFLQFFVEDNFRVTPVAGAGKRVYVGQFLQFLGPLDGGNFFRGMPVQNPESVLSKLLEQTIMPDLSICFSRLFAHEVPIISVGLYPVILSAPLFQ